MGEILFDFHKMNIGDKEDFKEYFDNFNNYSGKYKKLAEILNKSNLIQKID